MNTYTWQFTALDVYPTYAGLSNAVHTVHWSLTGSDGAGHVATAYGSQRIGAIDPQNFTPFANLTAGQVQGWVEAQMGTGDLADTKTSLDRRISNQVAPTSVTMVPPW